MSEPTFFETIRVTDSSISLAPYHLRRIQRTLQFLKWGDLIDKLPLEKWWYNFNRNLLPGDEVLRIDFIYKENQVITEIQKRAMAITPSVVHLRFAQGERDSSNQLWQFKLGGEFRKNHYSYNLNRNEDLIFINERGNLCETTIANILLMDQENHCCYTPPLSDGVLAGVKRASLLSLGTININEIAYPLIERSISKNLLTSRSQLLLCNALRGIYNSNLSAILSSC